MNAAFRAYNAAMGAFAQAVPDRVVAPGFDTTTIVAPGHLDREGGRYDVVIEVIGGGWGGGGYGQVAERAPEAVAADVRKGKITREHAGQAYGWKGNE